MQAAIKRAFCPNKDINRRTDSYQRLVSQLTSFIRGLIGRVDNNHKVIIAVGCIFSPSFRSEKINTVWLKSGNQFINNIL